MTIPPRKTAMTRVDPDPQREPDAHGQAAILLVESLIHGLVAKAALSVEEAIEIVSIAGEVKQEYALEMGDAPATMKRSLEILNAIHASLKTEGRVP